jgi:DNA-binding Lrp family transcriptional regulator
MNVPPLDAADRRIVLATQAGLPLVPRPYAAVAEAAGLTEQEVRARLSRMIASGVVRRIGLVPNHYALGLTHNAMTVWDVADDDIARLGAEVGALEFVTHCYERPRRLPAWPFNLFAMVHGRSDREIEDKTGTIASLLGDACRAHDRLVSTRILKKTGLRIAS